MTADTAGAGRAESVPEEFADFYTTTIEPQLDRLDEKRRQGVRRMIAGGAVVVLGLAALFLLKSMGIDGLPVAVACIAVAGLAGLGTFLSYRRARQVVKTALVEPGCRFLGYDYVQEPKGFPVARFYDLRLIRRHQQSSTHVEDGISGTHNGIEFRLCEVEIRDKRNKKEKKSNDDSLLFRGVLFISEFPRNFNGETRVLHSADRSLLPKSALDGSALESVYLEESRFSQSFHVYSSDQVEARYLLTPHFMELLMELVTHFNPSPELLPDLPPEQAEDIEQSWLYQKMMKLANSVSVAFVDNQMLISVRSRENRFEGGSVFKSLKDRQRVEQLLAELQIVPQILDTLALENR